MSGILPGDPPPPRKARAKARHRSCYKEEEEEPGEDYAKKGQDQLQHDK